jgi:signal transduction histidine kinase/ligand-binding sensor domain-containing protein
MLRKVLCRMVRRWGRPVRSLLGAGLTLGLLCINFPACAQYRFDVWTADDGLPQNIVRGIRQSADGYLWLATLDGLARFDGVRFTTFNKENTPGIASNRFTSMVQTTDGDLWLEIESGGITRYHSGSFATYGSERGIPGGVISGLNADHAGNLWILSHGRILLWQPGQDRFTDVTPAEPEVRYSASSWTNGGFWGVRGSTVYLFHTGILTAFDIPAALLGSPLWGAALDPDRSVILENRAGVQARVYPLRGSPPAQATTAQTTRLVDRSGHLWVMPVGHELRRSLPDVAGVPGGQISYSCYFEDRQGNLWLGTEGQGLYRFKRQVIEDLSTAQGLPSHLIYPLFQDSGGDIWVGVWGAGVTRFHEGRIVSTYPVSLDGSGGAATAIFEDRAHHLWVGSYAGLFIFDRNGFKPAVGPEPPDTSVQAITQGSDGTLWIGTKAGLAAYKDGKTTLYRTRDGLATDDVRTLVWGATPADADDLWIGGYGGLSRFRAGRFEHWHEADGLPSNTVRSLYEDEQKTLWIGTYDGGLGRFKNGRFTRYTEKDGLFNYGVFAILEDAHENLWMSSNRGIYRVAKSQLNRFAEGQLSTITSVAYGKGDGMLNAECNGGVWPSGVKARNGKLWFPTQGGIAVVDPNAIEADDQKPPAVIIEDARIDRVAVSVAGPLRVAPGKDGLEIEYTSPSFIKSDQIHFQYRLAGLESSWNDVGPRRTAYYSHLPPGRYFFQVMAGNGNGVWNMDGKTLEISVLPPYYRTWWFVLLLVLLAVLLLAWAWRYRVAQFETLQEVQTTFSRRLITSQETERKRIAGELHDGLGQRLVVINQLALLALRSELREAKPAEPAQTDGATEPGALEEISAEAALAIQEIRHISHDLRPFLLDRVGLSKAIQSILRTVSSACGLHIDSAVDDIDDFFPEELRINLFRIVQEAFNNIMKHSSATEVKVRVERHGEHLTMLIEDNGRGFAQPSRAIEARGEGFGLQGMMERAHLLGGILEFDSSPGRTIMTLKIKRQQIKRAVEDGGEAGFVHETEGVTHGS